MCTSPAFALPLSVLVVDSYQEAAASLAELVELHGHEVQTAHNGRDALFLSRTERFDVAFIELMIPAPDGFEIARGLRAGVSPPFMVALTGYDSDDHRRRAEDVGFQTFLLKPIDLESLDNILVAAFEKRRTVSKEMKLS